MKIFKSKPLIHHFKIHFPIPLTRIQSCITKIQQLDSKNTEAIFVSLNGFCNQPQMAQTLNNGFHITNTKQNIPVYTFLEQNATALTYFIATSGIISANPYCILGEVGTTHKTYNNIEKLLKFFNIKLDLLSDNKNQRYPWNPFTEPTERQKQISQKWLNVVQENMIKTVSQRRRLPLQTIRALKNKLFTPQQALNNKLIDHIQTAEEFKQIYFPQVKIQEHLFATTSKTPNISQGQVKILVEIEEMLSMPKVALFSMQDPINQCVNNVIELVKIRMQSPQKLEELDTILGNVFNNIQLKMQNTGQFIV